FSQLTVHPYQLYSSLIIGGFNLKKWDFKERFFKTSETCTLSDIKTDEYITLVRELDLYHEDAQEVKCVFSTPVLFCTYMKLSTNTFSKHFEKINLLLKKSFRHSLLQRVVNL